MGIARRLVQRSLEHLPYRLVRYPLSRKVPLKSHIREIFEHWRINCVLDVGAHEGQSGELYRDLGFTGHIFSFEPLPNDRLRDRVARDAKWELFPFALGDVVSTQSIRVAELTNLSSFLDTTEHCSAHFGDRAATRELMQVEIRTLDDVFPQLALNLGASPRPFLKLDTQGYDRKVLEGAGHTVKQVVAIQTETAVRPLYRGSPRQTEMHEYV